MNEEQAFEIINKFQIDNYIENLYFVIKYKYNPHTKKGKEFLVAFNLIFGDHGRRIRFDEMEYQVIQGRYKGFESTGDMIGTFINKHLENYAYAFLRPFDPTSVNVTTDTVDIQNVNQVTIYATTINHINAKKFMVEDELQDPNNTDLLNAINRIEKDLLDKLVPKYEDVSIVRKFARTTSDIAGFAADVITILGPFISLLR